MSSKQYIAIEYTGKWISVNDLRNNNWKKNQDLKKKLREHFAILLLEQKAKKMDQFKIEVVYNSRLDPDNVSMKYFVDAMKDIKIIVDDNKKYFRGFSIEPSSEIPHNTYIITIIEQ